MHIQSYKYYLHRRTQLNQPSPKQKLFLITILSILATVGFVSSFVYYVYAKELPIRSNYQHLQLLNSGYLSTKQSLHEVLISLQVAGTKIEIIDAIKEASSQASGFFTTLDDLERIILKLESAKKNIDSQKNQLNERATQLEDLNSQFLSYYNQAEMLLDNTLKDQKFLKEMHIASGPRFYLPALASENLWEKATQEKIKTYYENIKLEADSTLASLAKVSIPQTFGDFYETQLSYLDLLIKVSDSIISTLSINDSQNKDEATQIEKAYELLILANDQNQELSQKLLDGKLKIYDSKNNLSKFSQVVFTQNSLDEQITSAYLVHKQPKSNYIIDFILDLHLDQNINRLVKLI